jgi:polyphosphate kinase 2 (PPK2 family)
VIAAGCAGLGMGLGDLVRPDLEADQRVRAKGVGNWHVSRVAALSDQHAAASRHVIARIKGVPPPAKRGIVRRLAWALDPRSFKVLPRRCRRRREGTTCNAFGKIPEPGQIVVFDRSWYERVLPHSRRVWRVTGLCAGHRHLPREACVITPKQQPSARCYLSSRASLYLLIAIGALCLAI